MCGIYGFWQSPRLPDEAAQAVLQNMGDKLRHRGPDDHGTQILEPHGIALGHRRLSIIDLSPAGRQPMSTPDGRLVITFNGEIYNYPTLRQELQSLGYAFRTQTDTEVILIGYQQWGDKVFSKLAGIFALALWDASKDTLKLVRDPTGVKPLLYHYTKTHFAFASEAKGFLPVPGMKLEINRVSMATYLEFGYLYDNLSTLFTDVEKVPPGSMVNCTWKEGSIHISGPQAYWKYPQAEADRPLSASELDDLVEQLHTTLQEVVATQLQSDVPVGLLLSGGLDSSILAAYAVRALKEPLKTVCMGFDPTPLDERPYARQVADFLKTDHREMIFRPDDILSEIQTNILYYDDLFWDTGFLSSLAIYRSCKAQGLTVMLVGEGSDELFGGYQNFQSAVQHRWLPDQLFQYRQYRHRSGQQWGNSFQQMMRLQNRLLFENQGDRFQAVRQFELRHQIPNNLNMKVDRASMASSVEARVPFQDPRLLNLVCRWPTSALLGDGMNKRVLRMLAQKHQLLPAEIYQRQKFGMMLPGQWMEQASDFKNLARDAMLQPGGLADHFGLRKPMERFFAGKDDASWRHLRKHLAYNTVAWRLAILALWCDAWKREGVGW